MAEKKAKALDKSKPPQGFKVTVRNQPNEQGLGSIGQAERGRRIMVNGAEVAVIVPLQGDRRWVTVGWYWYNAGESRDLGIVGVNTLNRVGGTRSWPGTDEGKAQAEADARAYVIAQLWAAQEGKSE